MSKLKKPTKAMIKAGYWMMRASMEYINPREKYEDALPKAIKYTLKATKQLMAREGMFRNEAGQALKLLYKAQHVQIQYQEGTGRTVPLSVMNQHAEEIRDAHFKASRAIEKYGYRPPNKREFAVYGGGGDR